MIPVVILAGGTGTRLREMTEMVPKGLIPVGGIPVVVHIMRHYMSYGFKKFVLALGYKQDIFKQYFVNYDAINNDITVDIGRYRGVAYKDEMDWGMAVTLVDTGANTLKGGRLKRIEKYIDSDTFMCTYGDGLGDVDISSLLAYHKSHGKMVTVTGVHPVPRFGELHHEEGKVLHFREKQHIDEGCLSNGGFMVMNRGIFEYLTPDCDLEYGPMELLAAKGELMVFEHRGQWKCMDTLKDMAEIQQLWETGQAKWRT